MIEIPDTLQPYLKQLRKYHFWLLAVLMPLVLVPLAFTADATLIDQIGKRRREVKGKLDSLTQLARAEADGFEELGHPQAVWAEQLEQTTARLRRQLLAQWEDFWNAQQDLRAWPEELRRDFIERVTRLKPGDSLPPRLVERYQNTVRELVRKLPGRIDAEEQMQATDGFGLGERQFAPPSDPNQFEPDLLAQHIVSWDPADQSALYATFDWEKPPSTTQILLAQEELRGYETLCEAIAAANAGATGSHNATLASISQLAVGYRAAQSSPTGRGPGRVRRLQEGADGMGMDMGMGMGMGMDGDMAAGPPSNPRFTTGLQAMGDMMPEEMSASGYGELDESSDEALRNWIYVDATGRPLTADELEASPDTKLAHLVPFVIRGRVDQRKLDRLLKTLATWPVPIDVRQLRINPENGGELGGMDRPMPAGPMAGDQQSGSVRRYDFTVELRGTIALANRPDPAFLGLTDPAGSTALPAEE